MSQDQSDFITVLLQEELPLRSYLLAAIGNVNEVDDLFQNVARVLFEKFEDYDPQRPFRAWAMGVARLEVLKWRQKKARSREVLSPEALSQVAAAAEEPSDWTEHLGKFLHVCLGKLKETARRVVDMKYGDNLAIREIAKGIGKSVPAVEMVLVRSRRVLRECVERQMRSEERA